MIMKYERIERATFLERPNRFIAYLKDCRKTRDDPREEYRQVRGTSCARSRDFCAGE